jgi:uncharacterized membrane protein
MAAPTAAGSIVEHRSRGVGYSDRSCHDWLSTMGGAGMPTITDPDDRPTRWQVAARTGLGVTLAVAGLGHLTTQRQEFQAQVPSWVPIEEDVVVVVSGVVEILLGVCLVALLVPRLARYRVVVGLAVPAFFVAIFPGNVAQWVEGEDAFGLDTDTKRLVRLFFQPALVAWAIWSTGAWHALTSRTPSSHD